MNLLRQFCTAFALSILLMMASVPAGAGTYDAEMVKMATAIAASFDHKQQVKTIAVLDFTDLQGTVTELGKFLAEELSSDLVMGQKQFDVIDRANLKRLLNENKLSRSGLVDPETIKRLGKMAGADALVTGTVTPLGNSLRVSARIIHTETARIVGAAQANIDKTPEISELLRARVVENGGSGTTAVSSTPTDSTGSPARKVKLTYENQAFRATVASASFDKSANEITFLIDFTYLHGPSWGGGPLCLAAESASMFAIDEGGGQWNLVRMVGIRQGESRRYEDQDPAVVRHKANTWVGVELNATHRFVLVFAPSKADSPLTLNLTLGLYVGNTGLRPCMDGGPKLVSVGFDGVVATK